MRISLSLLALLLAHVGFAVDYLAETNLPDAGCGVETNGAKVVCINNTKVRFRDVAVKPNAKYTLIMEAGFEGAAESIEVNPRFAYFDQPGRTSPRLPSREIQFLDAAGKRVGQPLMHALPFRNTRRYQDVFHAPPDAIHVRLTIASGKDLRLRLRQLKIEDAPDEGALNVNPAFAFGYSGWMNIAAGGQLIERDGRIVLDTKYGSTGRMIPLPGPGTYGLTARAANNGYNSVVIVRIHDTEGQELMRASTRNYGPTTYFVPPKAAASASFLVYSCLLEEVRLIRVGDEKAILELQGK